MRCCLCSSTWVIILVSNCWLSVLASSHIHIVNTRTRRTALDLWCNVPISPDVCFCAIYILYWLQICLTNIMMWTTLLHLLLFMPSCSHASACHRICVRILKLRIVLAIRTRYYNFAIYFLLFQEFCFVMRINEVQFICSNCYHYSNIHSTHLYECFRTVELIALKILQSHSSTGR